VETEIFAELATAIRQLPHRTLLSDSPDHGQHLTEGGAGSHGSSNCTQLTRHDTFFCAVFPPGHCFDGKAAADLQKKCPESIKPGLLSALFFAEHRSIMIVTSGTFGGQRLLKVPVDFCGIYIYNNGNHFRLKRSCVPWPTITICIR